METESTPEKRDYEEYETDTSEENSPVKKKKTELFNGFDEKLDAFLKWCEENNFNLSPKVTVQRKGSCAQYGMIALEDIAEGYCLFQVPRSCILVPENSNISNFIKEDASIFKDRNKWIPLLLSLIHEQNNPNSKWRPYLDLVPDYKALDLPLFWNRSILEKHIANSQVDKFVLRDLIRIEDDYLKFVKPFFQRHGIISDLKDVEQLRKIVAFVMSYSFTEPKESEKAEYGDEHESSDEEEEQEMSAPMMVPMADMLNHVTKHNAKLTFGEHALKMVSVRNITKGEEIFNTYGEVSNLHLMHNYGFTECYPENVHDVVEIPVERMMEAASQIWSDGGSRGNAEILKEKWNYLLDQQVLSEDEVFVLNKDGIITDDICVHTMQVMCMTESEFKKHKEKEGWDDAESESSLSGESKLSFKNIPSCNEMWISLLKKMAEIHMSKYRTKLSDDAKKLKQAIHMPDRERFSLYLVHGQKMLLQELTDLCNSSLVQSLDFL